MKAAILVGSASDTDKIQPALDTLQTFGVEAELHVMSAHRNPTKVADWSKNARENGYDAIICAAGMAAALPGVVAAHTTLPVIGVPLTSRSSPLNGLDALYAVVQMPPGVPVATVAIDGAVNAALLVVAIGAVTDPDLHKRLEEYREGWQK